MRAAGAIHGPDGRRVDDGDEIPADWPAEFVAEMKAADLIKTGRGKAGRRTTRTADTGMRG